MVFLAWYRRSSLQTPLTKLPPPDVLGFPFEPSRLYMGANLPAEISQLLVDALQSHFVVYERGI